MMKKKTHVQHKKLSVLITFVVRFVAGLNFLSVGFRCGMFWFRPGSSRPALPVAHVQQLTPAETNMLKLTQFSKRHRLSM